MLEPYLAGGPQVRGGVHLYRLLGGFPGLVRRPARLERRLKLRAGGTYFVQQSLSKSAPLCKYLNSLTKLKYLFFLRLLFACSCITPAAVLSLTPPRREILQKLTTWKLSLPAPGGMICIISSVLTIDFVESNLAPLAELEARVDIRVFASILVPPKCALSKGTS